ncbi:MAG: hypothetical protein QF805_12925, partial [Pirellulaceae bacterium]|nr:hypothetical protein [Pirellulaceae bacterium]
MDKVFAAYEKQVDFYTIYIREAHPTDGWRLTFNDQFGIKATQPKSFDERLALADQCSSSLQLLCPMLVDTIDDKVAKAYAAFPDRLYLIDRCGKVAYKGGRGPFGYKPRELERSIVMLLLDQAREDAAEKAAQAAAAKKKAEKEKAAKAAEKKKAEKDEAAKEKAEKQKAEQT